MHEHYDATEAAGREMANRLKAEAWAELPTALARLQALDEVREGLL